MNKIYGEFSDKEAVLDYIADYGLYEGEGLEEAYKKFMSLPVEKRTESNLDEICDGIALADIDEYDPPEWIPQV